jgi:ABC-2 type transport system permease protein
MIILTRSFLSELVIPQPGLLLPAASLCKRELVRFLRQRSRIIGALVTPIMFWLVIGAGMGRSFNAEGIDKGYIEYFFPGTVVLILLFTAIFSTISIIEDRREGFLQAVLVAPVARQTIVLGKILGGTILAFGQGFLFLLLAPTVGVHFTIASFLLTLGMMLLLSFALTALGFCIAWRMSSTQGFHVIMNLFLLPMWFLSGALFPVDKAWGVMRWAMRINPLTYGLAGIKRAMYWGNASIAGTLPSLGICVLITLAFAAAMFLAAGAMARGHVAGDLQ